MRKPERTGYEPNDDFGFRQDEDAMGLNLEERDLWDKARSWDERSAIMLQRDARRLQEHKEQEKQEWQKTHAAQLLKKLGEWLAAYRDGVANDTQLDQK